MNRNTIEQILKSHTDLVPSKVALTDGALIRKCLSFATEHDYVHIAANDDGREDYYVPYESIRYISFAG